MAKRKPTERVIYSNYDLDETYEFAKEYLRNEFGEEPTDEEIWQEVSFWDECNWDDEKVNLEEVFGKGKFLAVGTCGRWDGNYAGGFRFSSFMELMSYIGDCDYFKFWDENGHFYIKATHHDGSHHLEIKKLTDKGTRHFHNWEFSLTDMRTLREVHAKLFNDSRYSHLIHFANRFYGCPKKAYEKGE